jgi:tetrapyrrole methylase family protein / MazG family protein
MKEFDELIDYCEKSHKLDPWVKKTGMEGYCKELNDEVQEVMQAFEHNDMENLKEELGDVFHDLIHVCLCAKKEELFDIKDVLELAVKKFNNRKPYIKEGKTVTIEEARAIWKKVKAKEKENNG